MTNQEGSFLSLTSAAEMMKEGLLVLLESRTFRLRVSRSNQKRGLRFHVYHHSDPTFDITKKTFGITFEGVPGDDVVSIDSFRIKRHYQRFGGWGSAILHIICDMYNGAGTRLIIITNYTAVGGSFYIKNRFVKQDWQDLYLYFQVSDQQVDLYVFFFICRTFNQLKLLQHQLRL